VLVWHLRLREMGLVDIQFSLVPRILYECGWCEVPLFVLFDRRIATGFVRCGQTAAAALV